MSDEQDKSVDSQPEAESSGPRGGERLAQARREQQISVLEVAKELHLDEPKVRALERNDFDVLGAPVFAKGHLRKYAQLVGVDEDDVFADYYAMTRSVSMPPIVVGRKKVRREISPGPWIAGIVVIIVAAAGYWWFAMRDTGPVPELSQPEQPPAEQIQPEQSQPDEVVSENDASDGTILLATAVPVDEPLPEVVQEPLPDGLVRLVVSFSGDCWTEISDADGRQLFVDMGRSGQTVELSGKAPISALFGNADNVHVRVNNGDYGLPAPTGANRTVRVAILSP